LVLEYVLSDPDSYCIVINGAGANLVRLGASRGRIELLVREYLDQVREKQRADQNARQLYTVLLSPIKTLASKNRLIVMPDGILHLLPFDALQSSTGQYVLDSAVVSYAPSATVLQFLRSNQRSRAPLPFLGVGDVAYDSGPGAVSTASTTRGVYDLAGAHFGLLPGSRSEILTAEQIFGSGSVALLGRNATETAFKHEPLSQFRVLHLAVHGIASPKYPERAALVLGRESNSKDDGLLQEREIADLALNSDLVTLSACDTAVGQLQGEEGIASLQRSFLVAGARATLSTLWNADDTFTAALIKQFYEKLASGMDKGSALREAKLELKQKFGVQATPFYWAGFVLDGNSWSPIISRQ
jgi:CHAT domain-containing protein